jgi:hypothetical protein
MNETKNETKPMCPGPAPEGETVVVDNPAFASVCMTLASSQASSYGWRLGKSLLTHSDVWGFIWRIDFRVKVQSQYSSSVSRLVFWSVEDNNAINGTATYLTELEPL